MSPSLLSFFTIFTFVVPELWDFVHKNLTILVHSTLIQVCFRGFVLFDVYRNLCYPICMELLLSMLFKILHGTVAFHAI